MRVTRVVNSDGRDDGLGGGVARRSIDRGGLADRGDRICTDTGQQRRNTKSRGCALLDTSEEPDGCRTLVDA